MTRPNGFTQREWNQFVATGRELVRRKTEAQFALGDLLLTKLPYDHGKSDGHVNEVLHGYADELGLSPDTLRTYRAVAHAWPAEKRVLTESWMIHEVFAAQPNRFRKIKKPPDGVDHWTTNEAQRSVARKPDYPVTTQERVERVRELLPTDEDAAAAVTTILRKPEVAKQVVGNASTRQTLHRAELSHYQERRQQDRPAPAPGTSGQARRQRVAEAPREILELLGICTSFYTQMQRAVPCLHVVDYDEVAKHTVLDSIARVRAAADWCETVITTGDTSMDEALARLLEGDT